MCASTITQSSPPLHVSAACNPCTKQLMHAFARCERCERRCSNGWREPFSGESGSTRRGRSPLPHSRSEAPQSAVSATRHRNEHRRRRVLRALRCVACVRVHGFGFFCTRWWKGGRCGVKRKEAKRARRGRRFPRADERRRARRLPRMTRQKEPRRAKGGGKALACSHRVSRRVVDLCLAKKKRQ